MLRKWICALLVLCLAVSTLSLAAFAVQTGDDTQAPTQTTTDPPATDPPATDPPATDPPATDPPATDPPATDPPVTDPPATEAPTEPDPSGSCGAALTWTLSRQTGALTISGTGPMDDCTNQPWGAYASQIRSVKIASGVTSIGSGAFKNLTALTSVEIPGTVYLMGTSVFEGCAGLTSVQIPTGITVIPYGTFSGCTGLTKVTIPDNILCIERYAFANCTALKTVRFTSDAPDIFAEAFAGVTATAVYPGINVTWADKRIDYGGTLAWEPDTPRDSSGLFGTGFSWIVEDGTLTITGKGNMPSWESGSTPPWYHLREQVTAVVMNGKIWSIYTGAFKDMSNLKTITWPEDLNIIYSSVFYNCTSLEKVDIPYSVTNIKDYAFYGCTSLSNVSLPSRLKELARGAFGNCKALESVLIPETVTTLGREAFFYSGLKSITLPKGITSLESGTFRGCRQLADVTIMGNVTQIGKQCFESCAKLKGLSLPSSVKSIGEEAFSGSGLVELVFGGDMPTFGTDALKGTKANIFYPKANTTWSESRVTVLEDTYSGAVTCYAGTPDDFEVPTEPAETTLPTEPAETTLPTEETVPADTEEALPSESVPAGELSGPDEPGPDAEEQLPETQPRTPEEQDSGRSILSYWPIAVAVVCVLGGSALAVWFLLLRKPKGKYSRKRRNR